MSFPNLEINKFFQKALIWDSDECLIWPFGKIGGYACWNKLRKSYKTHYVSKVICLLKNGKQPTELHEVAHTCKNGHLGCINHRHLRWVTRNEHAVLDRSGENNPNSKLTKQQVIEIRKSNLSNTKLAIKYNIS